MLIGFLLALSVNAQSWNEVQKVVPSDREWQDEFAYSVNVSGDYAMAGAIWEDHDTLGLSYVEDAGSVYVFNRDVSGVWNEVQKLTASNREEDDHFGFACAISGDYAVISAPNDGEDELGVNTQLLAGSAYIFERNGSGYWVQVQKIVASDRQAGDAFGFSVDISNDRLIIGAYKEQHDTSGLNAMTLAGSAYIFERDLGGTWVEVQKIVASDRNADDYFGYSVGLSGDYAVVGAHRESEDELGGNTLSFAGSIYIYERDGTGVWNEAQKVVASDRGANDWFGFSVDISSNYVISGAYWESEDELGGNSLTAAGSAYVFERDGTGTWLEANKLVASDRAFIDFFGISVAISGNNAVIGANWEDQDTSNSNTINQAGSAYIFNSDGSGNWSQSQKIVASDRGDSDEFGLPVAIDGNHIIVGAVFEDHDATGANFLDMAGSAYIFETEPITSITEYVNPGLMLFPNPTSGSFTIQLVGQSTEVTVTNLLGEKVRRYRVSGSELLVDLSDQPKGLYIVTVVADKKNYVSRVILE